jgi:uncharacterized GH25 family protein
MRIAKHPVHRVGIGGQVAQSVPIHESVPATATSWGALLGIVMLFASAPALAHYPWVTVHEEEEQGTSFRISFGHQFPVAGRLQVDRLEGVHVVYSDGRVEALELEEREYHPLPAAAEGARMIVAEQKPAYWSRTHEGGQTASREQYPDAFSCSQSTNSMKAFAGKGPGVAWKYRQGHGLELVPLVDPTGLGAGDPLSVQVLLHGEPWEGEVHATHAAYSRDGEDDYLLTVRTDADGVAHLVPAASDHWLVQAHASEDYPDPAVCDRRSYYSTLTFTLR